VTRRIARLITHSRHSLLSDAAADTAAWWSFCFVDVNRPRLHLRHIIHTRRRRRRRICWSI